MSQVVSLISAINHDITRHFQLDYILFDLAFLVLYVGILVWQERYAALRAGLVCSILIYVIDGIIWNAAGVREYGISARWMKHPVDFMMDISYGIVAFSWVWIAFERRSVTDVVLWTLLLFAGWLVVPLLSLAIELVDERVMTVRHMASQVWVQIVVVLVGYAALLALRYRLLTILYVFWIGSALSLMMELSLMVSGIRPANASLLLYETLILTNQGIPYVYIIWDKILPRLRKYVHVGRRSTMDRSEQARG